MCAKHAAGKGGINMVSSFLTVSNVFTRSSFFVSSSCSFTSPTDSPKLPPTFRLPPTTDAIQLKSMQRYKIKTQNKIKPQDAQAAIRQGKVSYQNRLFLRAYSQGGQAKTSHREPSFFVPTLKILVPPVLHHNQSATISRDVRFQLSETVDGFQQEVDEVIDANAAVSGTGEGQRR
ncbi:hypothetical protein C8J57DRAFT_1503504 [Mycena rebaudengoi]|nr:hypothetical protein C8J57DRAFT_1503504 [Mycena rebaudengoi]